MLAAQRLAELLLRTLEAKTTERKVRQQMRQEAETLLHGALAVYEDLGITTGKEAVQALRVPDEIYTSSSLPHLHGIIITSRGDVAAIG